MSWAGERRATIITIVSSVVLAILCIFGFTIWYETPTCFDKKQNQDEVGIDCGGSCRTLCASQVSSVPVVRFARVLTPQPGRSDVIAYVENRNSDAEAPDAPFVLEVYDANRGRIARKTVQVDLPPSSSVPVYVPDVTPRGTIAAAAFLSPITEDVVWHRVSGEREVLPTVEQVSIEEGEMPRITAVLVNPQAKRVYNTKLVATVFDPSGNAIAASQTLVTVLPSQGTAPLVFTWNAPFSATNVTVQILPVPEVERAP